MKKSIILTTATVAMLIGTTLLAAKKYDLFQKDSETAAVSESENIEPVPEDDTYEPETEVTASEESTKSILTEEDVTYQPGEECEVSGWKYYLKSVNVTKSREGMDRYCEGYLETDEDGNLNGDYSFFTVDIDITNNTDTANSMYVNSLYVQLINYVNNEISIEDYGILSMYVFNGERSVYEKSYFLCDFEPHEKKSYRLGFYEKDSLLDKKYQVIRLKMFTECPYDIEDVRFYKLGENICLNDLRQPAE